MGAQKKTVPKDHWIMAPFEIMDLLGGPWETHKKRIHSATFPTERCRIGRSKYDLKVYLEWLLNVHLAVNSSDQMAKEKLRHEKYKADKAMYDAEERARQLLSRDEVVSGLSLLLTGMKNKFLAWIKRLPGLLANKSAREIEPILEHELYVILSDLAKGIKKLIPKEKKSDKKK